MTSMTIQEAATRALDDAEFAQRVLAGEEDFPEVRDAILADMYADVRGEEPEAQGFGLGDGLSALNPQPLPPQRLAACYVRYYPKMPADTFDRPSWDPWTTLPRTNLTRVAGR